MMDALSDTALRVQLRTADPSSRFIAESRSIDLEVILRSLKVYSLDLRQRVLDALERGMSRKEAIIIFAVSEGSNQALAETAM